MSLNKIKTCIYLRKSREETSDEPVEETLRKHETTLLAFAKENKISILEIKKEVISGESLSKRPEMLKMLEEIEDGFYEAVLVMDFDRLCRGDMLDQGIIISTLKRNDVRIITLDRIYNLNDDMDEEMVDFNAFFARKELKMITKRMGRGRMKSLEEGNYIGGHPPLGYNYNKATKRLEVNEEEAKIVKSIFDMYVNQDMGDSKIATFMRDNNIKTKLNKTWDKVTARKIVKNPIYIGIVTWGKSSKKNPTKEFKGKHEPIIDKVIFYKAQELAKKRYISRKKDNYKERNPLSGLVKCTCGRTMSLRTSEKDFDSLRCPANCGNKSTYVNIIEKKLLEILEIKLKDINSELQEIKPLKLIDKHSLVIEANTKDLNKSIEQKNKLFDLLEQGVYDNKTFLERMSVITKRIESLENIIEDTKLKQGKADIQNINELPNIKRLISYIQEIYWSGTVKDKNDFLHEIVEKIIFKKTEKGIDLFQLEVYLKL